MDAAVYPMDLLQTLHNDLTPFLAVVAATGMVAFVCHYFTSAWPSTLESLFWDFMAVAGAWAAFACMPLWHIYLAPPLPWEDEPTSLDVYWSLVKLACLGAVTGFVLGALLMPIAFKRIGWWNTP